MHGIYNRVILESLDGCGKTTLYNYLVDIKDIIPGGKYPSWDNSVPYYFNIYTKELYDTIEEFNKLMNIDSYYSSSLYLYMEKLENILYKITKILEDIMYLNINDQMYPITTYMDDNKYRGRRHIVQDRGILSVFIYNYLELVYWKKFLEIFQKVKIQKYLSSEYNFDTLKRYEIANYLSYELVNDCLSYIDSSMLNIWSDFNNLLKYKSPFNNIFESDTFIILTCNEGFRRSYLKEKKEVTGEEPYKQYYETDEINDRLEKYMNSFKSMITDLNNIDDGFKFGQSNKLIKYNQIKFINVTESAYNKQNKYYYKRRDFEKISRDVLNIIGVKENNNEE